MATIAPITVDESTFDSEVLGAEKRLRIEQLETTRVNGCARQKKGERGQ